MEYETIHAPPNGSSVPTAPAAPSPVPQDATSDGYLPLPTPPASAASSSAPPPTSRKGRYLQHEDGTEVIYPYLSAPNLAMKTEPLRKEDPVLGELFRPALVPSDLDDRINSASVWIKLVPGTMTPIYFVPDTCDDCARMAQFCDRSQPTCSRCAQRGVPCASGGLKHLIVPDPLPLASEERRYSASEKGKARAKEENGHAEEENGDHDDENDEGGRGKRIKKKRRLSDSEVDPNTLNFDGTGLKKARGPRPRSSIMLAPAFMTSALQPEDHRRTEADEAYERACKHNLSHRYLLDGNIRGFCPAWADRRRALYAAVSSMRAPVRSDGCLVSIGASGAAQGILLDQEKGQTVLPTYWGEDGVIRVTLGRAQRRRGAQAPPRASSPPAVLPNLADEYQRAMDKPAEANGKTEPEASQVASDDPALEALFMSQRAGLPVLLGVTQACSSAPFQIPKDTVVLGWFWILAAWAETPKDGPFSHVRWRFHFHWCNGQDQPWYVSKDARETYEELELDQTLSAEVRGPGILGPSTARGSDTRQHESDFQCSACRMFSEEVYGYGVCLNERCPEFSIHPEGTKSETLPTYAAKRLLLTPAQLGLDVMPPAPSKTFADLRQSDAGRDFWRAWVCIRCRMANERRDWLGFLCEACALLDVPKRKVFSATALAGRAIPSTGPRADDGYPGGGLVVKHRASYPDSLKIVHSQAEGTGGMDVVHALGADPIDADSQKLSTVAHAVLRGLQIQGKDEVPFRRHMLSATSVRAGDLALCPFYTLLVGASPVPHLAHFPAGPTLPLDHAPRVARDMLELVNERRARMSTGRLPWDTAPVVPYNSPFDSLLLAAMPPVLPSTMHPTIPVPRDTTLALLTLGSDFNIRFRHRGKRRGEILAAHGDVVLVKAGSDDIEVEVRNGGFGFVGIARVALPPDTPVREPGAVGWYVGGIPVDPTQSRRVTVPEREEGGDAGNSEATAEGNVPQGPSAMDVDTAGDSKSTMADSANPEPASDAEAKPASSEAPPAELANSKLETPPSKTEKPAEPEEIPVDISYLLQIQLFRGTQPVPPLKLTLVPAPGSKMRLAGGADEVLEVIEEDEEEEEPATPTRGRGRGRGGRGGRGRGRGGRGRGRGRGGGVKREREETEEEDEPESEKGESEVSDEPKRGRGRGRGGRGGRGRGRGRGAAVTVGRGRGRGRGTTRGRGGRGRGRGRAGKILSAPEVDTEMESEVGELNGGYEHHDELHGEEQHGDDQHPEVDGGHEHAHQLVDYGGEGYEHGEPELE